jgi:hypothetical protein
MERRTLLPAFVFQLCALFLVTAALATFCLLAYASFATALIAAGASRLVITLFPWHSSPPQGIDASG